jgi:hypothetical protein
VLGFCVGGNQGTGGGSDGGAGRGVEPVAVWAEVAAVSASTRDCDGGATAYCWSSDSALQPPVYAYQCSCVCSYGVADDDGAAEAWADAAAAAVRWCSSQPDPCWELLAADAAVSADSICPSHSLCSHEQHECSEARSTRLHCTNPRNTALWKHAKLDRGAAT